jgi:hypothetical protein
VRWREESGEGRGGRRGLVIENVRLREYKVSITIERIYRRY